MQQTTNNSQTQTAADLRTLIDDTHRNLLFLRRRQYALEAFMADVNRVSRGATFDVHNDVRWLQLFDFRDKNVIDLASWAKGHYSKGGLFGVIGALHLAAFPRTRSWGGVRPGDRQDEHYAQVRRERFGSPAGAALKPQDVQVLHDEFASTFKPVVDDRSGNRAHVYERCGTGNARMLDVKETRELFEYAHRMLNDLSFLAYGSTTSDVDLNIVSVEGDAEETVDDLLLPRYSRTLIVRAGVDRDAVYDALHTEPHDRDGKPAFNTVKAVHRALVKLGVSSDIDDD